MTRLVVPLLMLAALAGCSKKKSGCVEACEQYVKCLPQPPMWTCDRTCDEEIPEERARLARCREVGARGCPALMACLKRPRSVAQDAKAAVDAGVANPRAGWDLMALQQFDKAKLLTHGTIEVPPGSAVKESRVQDSSGHDTGGMLTVLLPTGQHVLLIERGPDTGKDPDVVKQILGAQMKVDLRGATWFVFGMAQDDSGTLALQGYTWAAEPGLSCGVEEMVDRPTFDQVVEICSSLAAIP